MRKKNGFIISTTLYSIFGIMLLTVFYILYALSNNRYLLTTSINNIKETLEKEKPSTPPSPSVPIFIDTSGANKPILADGMIPVVYDESCDENEGCWVRADAEAGYYAYQDQIWANAVTVTSTNRAKYLSDSHIGKKIPMDEINSMWVWIPRYKYNIDATYGTHEDETLGTQATPGLINVEFESNTSISGASYSEYITSTTTKYYTHPAFRDGSKVYNTTPYDLGGWTRELRGIWVAKFERGAGAVIKPDVRSSSITELNQVFEEALQFANGTINSSEVTFTTNASNTYGLNTTSNSTNTHAIKSTEWGAVAILSQSKYGKMGNNDYEGANKEIYINNANGITNTPYTGRSGGEPNTAHKYDLQQGYVGNYSYNDNTCLKGQTLCTGEKIPNAGTGASTTGNIYGIYDMNGGREEYVMGINLGTGTCPNIGTYIYQNKQYYDEFNSGTNYRIIYGTATDETKSWYNDSYSRSTTFNCTVEYRGGSSKNEDSSAAKDDGIFSVGYGSYNTGSATVLNGYRVTLIP